MLPPSEDIQLEPLYSVSISVPTRNRGDLIVETLRSLLAIEYPNIQIMIIDQSSNSDTKDAVAAVAGSDPRVHYIATRTVGSSAARNLAACLSEADIMAYTDDDCIVDPDWIDALLREFKDAHTVAVYGRLLPYEGGRTGREVGFKGSLERQVLDRRTPPWHIGHGGNMAFRRASLLEIGGFDPTLGAGDLYGACEDGDIAYRFLVRQQRVVYTPDALAYHKHWKDWGSQKRMERNYGVGAGAQFAKYIRCGESYGWRLLALWIWQLGLRRIMSGLLKWRDFKVIYLGYCQLIYPWVGVFASLRSGINQEQLVYIVPPQEAGT